MLRTRVLGCPRQGGQVARGGRSCPADAALCLEDVACSCSQGESTTGALRVLYVLHRFERDGWVCREHDGRARCVKEVREVDVRVIR